MKYFNLKSKLEIGIRLLLLNYFSGIVPVFLVTEYPKSGGTWLAQLISSYFDLPFPRNKIPGLKKSMFHGHYLPSRNFIHLKKIFLMFRDGRDVMVSLYYHTLFLNEKNRLNPKDYYYYRSKLKFKDYNDIKRNLPKFIEFVFSHRPSKLYRIKYEGNWVSFNKHWLEQNYIPNDKILYVKYEDLLNDTEREIIRILKETDHKEPDVKKVKNIVNKYSFENQVKRAKGEENISSFLRKGVAGDWKNKFSKEAAIIYDHYAGEMLIKLGYEKDHNWVNKF